MSKAVYIDHGSNYANVYFPKLTVWISYSTVIGFQVWGKSPVVIGNYWGPTTGKHLNAIDGGNKKGRLRADDFKKALAEALKSFGLSD